MIKRIIILLILVNCLSLKTGLFAQTGSGTLSLDGTTLSLDSKWKFKTGDDLNWAKPDSDDKDWTDVFPYYTWDVQNIDYQGYAWYRVSFTIPQEWKGSADKLYLYLGRINDADQTYLNGQLLGENGELLKPETKPANGFADAKDKSSIVRNYVIATNDGRIKWNGKNVLAVRVYAGDRKGGFNKGNKLVSAVNPLKTYTIGWTEEYILPQEKGIMMEMGDKWKVKVGDDPLWKGSDFDDSNWSPVSRRGSSYRDTMAWFRTKLVIPSGLKSNSYFKDELVFYLGRMFDKADLYLNGVSLEKYRIPSRDIVKYYPYALENVYYLPADASCIKWDGENVVAVRMYNKHDWGGGGFKGGWGEPKLFMANFFNLVDFKFNRLPSEIQARTPIDIDFNATSYSQKRKISATLEYKVYDRFTREVADANTGEIDIYNDRENKYLYRFLPLDFRLYV